ncbi:hypothetical protein KCU88_g297, partial [Aureobasidium melanogenum]
LGSYFEVCERKQIVEDSTIAGTGLPGDLCDCHPGARLRLEGRRPRSLNSSGRRSGRACFLHSVWTDGIVVGSIRLWRWTIPAPEGEGLEGSCDESLAERTVQGEFPLLYWREVLQKSQ